MRSLVVAFVLLSPAVAFSQAALTIQFADAAAEKVVNAEDCGELLRLTWNTQATACTPGGELRLWATTGECEDEKAAGDVEFPSVSVQDVNTQRTGFFDVEVGELPGFQGADAGRACGAPGFELTHRICGALKVASFAACDTVVRVSAPPTIVYDSLAPAAPVIDEIAALDGALQVSVSVGTDVREVHLETAPEGSQEFQRRVSFSSDLGSARIEGLENGVTVQVRAIAEDAAENLSAPSEVRTGTPVESRGFFSSYVEGGGSEQGGCSAAGGSVLVAAAVVLLAGVALRRRRS